MPPILYLTTSYDPEPVRLEWDSSAWVGSRACGRVDVVDPCTSLPRRVEG
jgi:hypothetical protein